jgi:hypothetical protein
MRKFLVLTFVLFFSGIYSQSDKKKLFILYKNDSGMRIGQSKNDTMSVEAYVIDFTKSSKSNLVLDIGQDGNLKIKYNIVYSRLKILDFIYINQNSDNNPILVNKKTIRNVLKYNVIIDSIKDENFVKILNNFDIYFINEDEALEDYYVAKKVQLQKDRIRI